jgi:hypothetical protein
MIGTVEKVPYAVGSKSEYNAVILKTPQGEFRLRRLGGSSFEDGVLDNLVGCRVRARGAVHGSTLILDGWDVLEGSDVSDGRDAL